MNKKKIMSLIMALVMLVGVFSPLTALAANNAVTEPTGKVGQDQLQDTKPTETTVNLYKLTTKTKYNFDKPLNHTGGQIEDLKTLGADVTALAGAQFTFYKINGKNDVENEKILELLKANASSFKTVAQMNDLIANGKTELTPSKVDNTMNAIAKNKLAIATGDGLTDGHTADTDKNGLATVTLGEGYYWVVESKAPDKVTGQIAVPFGLTLPLTNAYDVTDENGDVIAKAGTKYLNPVHIYPDILKHKLTNGKQT